MSNDAHVEYQLCKGKARDSPTSIASFVGNLRRELNQYGNAMMKTFEQAQDHHGVETAARDGFMFVNTFLSFARQAADKRLATSRLAARTRSRP